MQRMQKIQKTTIQVAPRTLERLKQFKKFPRESYDDVLNSLFDEAEDDTLSDEEIEDIKKGLENVKKGKVYPIEQVAKEFGIKLKAK